MKIFGWVLFGVGLILVVLAGFVGLDVGIKGMPSVMNLAGVLSGVGLMISGSVFAAVGQLIETSEAGFSALRQVTVSIDSGGARGSGKEFYRNFEIYKSDGRFKIPNVEGSFSDMREAKMHVDKLVESRLGGS